MAKRTNNDIHSIHINKGNNKITELRTILQRESQNSIKYINRQNQSTTGKGDNGKSYLSFNSLGKSYLSLTDEKIFLEINQSETRIACGGHVC